MVEKKVFRTKVHVHDVIAVRNDEGKVAIYDAFCPHLGADLGVGSEVVVDNDSKSGPESCIRCPFHGWLFSNNDGSCVRVPYSATKCRFWFSLTFSITFYCKSFAARRRTTRRWAEQVGMFGMVWLRVRVVPC